MYYCTKHFYYCLNASLKEDPKIIEKNDEIIGLLRSSTKFLGSIGPCAGERDGQIISGVVFYRLAIFA